MIDIPLLISLFHEKDHSIVSVSYTLRSAWLLINSRLYEIAKSGQSIFCLSMLSINVRCSRTLVLMLRMSQQQVTMLASMRLGVVLPTVWVADRRYCSRPKCKLRSQACICMRSPYIDRPNTIDSRLYFKGTNTNAALLILHSTVTATVRRTKKHFVLLWLCGWWNYRRFKQWRTYCRQGVEGAYTPCINLGANAPS